MQRVLVPSAVLPSACSQQPLGNLVNALVDGPVQIKELCRQCTAGRHAGGEVTS